MKKAGNAWFQRHPTVTYGTYADIVSSGTINFNDTSHGAHAKHIVDVDNKNYHVEAWAQTSPVNWPGNISIIVTNPQGVDVLSKTVTNN